LEHSVELHPKPSPAPNESYGAGDRSSSPRGHLTQVGREINVCAVLDSEAWGSTLVFKAGEQLIEEVGITRLFLGGLFQKILKARPATFNSGWSANLQPFNRCGSEFRVSVP
jgi:hypothetical protein